MFSIRTSAACLTAAAWLITAAANAQAPSDELHMNVIQETVTFKKADIAEAELLVGDGLIVIAITLSPDGAKRFAALTAQHVGKPMQIVVGDRILTTPRIREPIAGGRLQITGNFSRAEAEAILARLR